MRLRSCSSVRKDRMAGDRIIQRNYQGLGRRLSTFGQINIPFFGYRKEGGLMLGRNTHQRSQGSKVFALPLSHLLHQIVQIGCHEGVHLL